MKIAIASTLMLSLTIITAAQNPPSAFEVVSIKRHVRPNDGVGITISGPRLKATNNSVISLITFTALPEQLGLRLESTKAPIEISTLKRLIQNAYQSQPYQVYGGPAWLNDAEKPSDN
jgi:hypothetical protein